MARAEAPRTVEQTQCTIVTEYEGMWSGMRMIRGREKECSDHYTRRTLG